jgi:hypothetical protein
MEIFIFLAHVVAVWRLMVSEPVSLGDKPHLGLITRYLVLFDSYNHVLLWRILWREVGSVSWYTAGTRQHSLSRVRVLWDSWPYITLSDLRVSFLCSPTTLRVTVEVFESPPRGWRVSRQVSLVIYPRHGSHGKRLFRYYVFSRCRRKNVSAELFPSNGRCTVACLHSCYLVMSIHVTVFVAWHLIKHSNNFTFSVQFKGVHKILLILPELISWSVSTLVTFVLGNFL